MPRRRQSGGFKSRCMIPSNSELAVLHNPLRRTSLSNSRSNRWKREKVDCRSRSATFMLTSKLVRPLRICRLQGSPPFLPEWLESDIPALWSSSAAQTCQAVVDFVRGDAGRIHDLEGSSWGVDIDRYGWRR